MTGAELRLWFHVRDRRLAGYRFRRQHPIGPYFADSRAWSVVSSSNLTEGNTLRETKRIAAEPRIWNAEAGAWSAIWDSDALKHPQFVLEAILLELNRPHPSPLPRAGEGTLDASKRCVA